MSLAARRLAHELEHVILPARAAEIADICGRAVPYTVDWASFGADAESLAFVDNLGCHRVNMALRVLCADDPGRAAVRDGLHAIVLANAPEPADKRLEFVAGVLTLRGAWAYRSAGMFGDGEIRALLEARL